MRYLLFLFLTLFSFQACIARNTDRSGSDSRVSFSVSFKGEKTDLRVFSFFVLPGEKLSLSVSDSNDVDIKSSAGDVKKISAGNWNYTAPGQKGVYDLILTNGKTGEEMLLHIFVMVPATKMRNGVLNGYRIGHYPRKKYKDYKNPKGFVEVTKDNMDVNITPHFKLKQFLCKQAGGWPKYVVMKPRMLRKLELMLDKLHEEGVTAKTFVLMSAYRTPYYNKSIGNVKYSRHVFGDAIDLYVDDDGDGRIDDLNKDGKISIKDARVIAKVVEHIEKDPKYKEFIGGMGVYNKNSSHTYFVHVDTRGYKARW